MRLPAYEAALNNVVYFCQAETGVLRLSGADRVDFLQRQTTNDLRLLTTERIVSTVLTSPTARILDVFSILDVDESLMVLSLSGRFQETFKFLRSRIFFSDQVTIDDLSTDFSLIYLFGPQLDSVLQNLNLKIPEPDHFINVEINRHLITMIAQNIHSEIGCWFLLPRMFVDAVAAALEKEGATTMSPDIFEILRVESGQPGTFGELTEAYTPLEIQLQALISDTKGCYTGQEIIARQITYDKVTKKLVGIRLDDLVDVGAKIEIDGKSGGTLTSVVQSPRFGVIGLAVLRRQYCEAGTDVSVLRQDGSSTEGEVVKIPFR